LTLRAYYNRNESSVLTTKTTTPPLDATNFVCSDRTTQSITLNWTKSASSGILAAQNLYKGAQLINMFGTGTQTSLVSDLTSATEYTFRLTSLNANGDESAGVIVKCNTTSGTPPDTTPPTG